MKRLIYPFIAIAALLLSACQGTEEPDAPMAVLNVNKSKFDESVLPQTPQHSPFKQLTVDFFTATLELFPDKGQTVSKSYLEIKKLQVGVGNSTVGYTYKTVKIEPENNPSESISGPRIPIYWTAFFENTPRDYRLRIECEFYIENETYNFWRKNRAEKTKTIAQEFYYNSLKRRWEPLQIEDPTARTNSIEAYYKFAYQEKIGRAWTVFVLPYTLICDDVRYPIIKE